MHEQLTGISNSLQLRFAKGYWKLSNLEGVEVDHAHVTDEQINLPISQIDPLKCIDLVRGVQKTGLSSSSTARASWWSPCL